MKISTSGRPLPPSLSASRGQRSPLSSPSSIIFEKLAAYFFPLLPTSVHGSARPSLHPSGRDEQKGKAACCRMKRPDNQTAVNRHGMARPLGLRTVVVLCNMKSLVFTLPTPTPSARRRPVKCQAGSASRVIPNGARARQAAVPGEHEPRAARPPPRPLPRSASSRPGPPHCSGAWRTPRGLACTHATQKRRCGRRLPAPQPRGAINEATSARVFSARRPTRSPAVWAGGAAHHRSA